MIWSMLANVGAYVAVSLLHAPERRGAPPGEPVRRRVQAAGRGRRARFWRGTRVGARAVQPAGALRRPERGRRGVRRLCARARRGAPEARGQADADLVHFVEKQLAGVIGAASAHIMLASVVKEEALTLDEVRAVLDEASQIVVYSHRLEQKIAGARARHAGAARGERAAHRARPHEGRVRLHGVARAAHAAHLDPLVHRDPARQPAAAGRGAPALPRHRDQGDRAADAPDRPGARRVAPGVGARRVARVAARHARGDRGHRGLDQPAVPGARRAARVQPAGPRAEGAAPTSTASCRWW